MAPALTYFALEKELPNLREMAPWLAQLEMIGEVHSFVAITTILLDSEESTNIPCWDVSRLFVDGEGGEMTPM